MGTRLTAVEPEMGVPSASTTFRVLWSEETDGLADEL
jgi:hypothetical protein